METSDAFTLRSSGPPQPAESRAYCILNDGNGVRMVGIEPNGREMSFGRSSQASVTVRGNRVSREHVILRWAQGSLLLRDNHSTNGTLLNGVAIEPGVELTLSSGDEIAFGDATITVGITAPPQPTGRRLLSYSQLWERLSLEFLRARRHRRPLGLCMVQIRGEGRRGLERLLDLVDPLDVLAEYGPGEYVLLVPEFEPEAGLARLQGLIEDLSSGRGVKAAGGLARLPGGASGADKLLEEARHALGRALLLGQPLVVHQAAEEPPGGASPGGGVLILDPGMEQLFALVDKVAPTDVTVLITGETGVGKGVLAAEIHRRSQRARGQLLCLNCASIPETLLESELFGFEAGAFTGASRRKKGLFEAAREGTLLLDEVGELSLPVQAKLLRVLEQKSLVRLGGTSEVKVDVRVLAATNQDLERGVATGGFRQDLLFRLNGFTLEVPPLRRRREEILPLAEQFARQFAAGLGRPAPRFTERAALDLVAHAWPGNIRELRNVVERAVILAETEVLDVEHLPESVSQGSRGLAGVPGEATATGAGVKQRLDELERLAISDALRACGGNRTHAAKRLGISRRSLLYKIKKHGIQ